MKDEFVASKLYPILFSYGFDFRCRSFLFFWVIVTHQAYKTHVFLLSLAQKTLHNMLHFVICIRNTVRRYYFHQCRGATFVFRQIIKCVCFCGTCSRFWCTATFWWYRFKWRTLLVGKAVDFLNKEWAGSLMLECIHDLCFPSHTRVLLLFLFLFPITLHMHTRQRSEIFLASFLGLI